ncbi:MAG TPA: hypothetical protein VIN04_00630 [Myxococcota bacterium]
MVPDGEEVGTVSGDIEIGRLQAAWKSETATCARRLRRHLGHIPWLVGAWARARLVASEVRREIRLLHHAQMTVMSIECEALRMRGRRRANRLELRHAIVTLRRDRPDEAAWGV